ncbi:MAG: hypothetical protein KAI57_01105 [Candidatus Pacebacteria bacterium]|nr:hypothetical protein [Candidatus Paceibacterota bacterium]
MLALVGVVKRDFFLLIPRQLAARFFIISAPLLIVITGFVLGFIFFGWMFRDSKEVNKQALFDPQKEAKRIFDELKD